MSVCGRLTRTKLIFFLIEDKNVFAFSMSAEIAQVITENKRSSIRQLCYHCWHCKVSLGQLIMPSVTTQLSKWRSFVFSGWIPSSQNTRIYLSHIANIMFIVLNKYNLPLIKPQGIYYVPWNVHLILFWFYYEFLLDVCDLLTHICRLLHRHWGYNMNTVKSLI